MLDNESFVLLVFISFCHKFQNNYCTNRWGRFQTSNFCTNCTYGQSDHKWTLVNQLLTEREVFGILHGQFAHSRTHRLHHLKIICLFLRIIKINDSSIPKKDKLHFFLFDNNIFNPVRIKSVSRIEVEINLQCCIFLLFPNGVRWHSGDGLCNMWHACMHVVLLKSPSKPAASAEPQVVASKWRLVLKRWPAE